MSGYEVPCRKDECGGTFTRTERTSPNRKYCDDCSEFTEGRVRKTRYKSPADAKKQTVHGIGKVTCHICGLKIADHPWPSMCRTAAYDRTGTTGGTFQI